MHNRGWVIAGIIGFLAVAAFPFTGRDWGRTNPFLNWNSGGRKTVCGIQGIHAGGSHAAAPCLANRRGAGPHADLYGHGWKGIPDEFADTCMGCHKSKERFCDRCHEYSDVTPPCWECHVAPPQAKTVSSVE